MEAYWGGKVPAEEVTKVSAEVKKATWTGLKERGVDIIPRFVAARCADDQQLKSRF